MGVVITLLLVTAGWAIMTLMGIQDIWWYLLMGIPCGVIGAFCD